MNATEQHVAMAAKMYECRSAARRLLGDKFNQQMDERARVVRAVAKRDNCNEIVAGATVIKEAGLQGMDALLLMAAVVEMTEPSNAPHEGPGAASSRTVPLDAVVGGLRYGADFDAE